MLTAGKRNSYLIVTFDQCRQVEIDDLTIADPDITVDDAEIDLLGMAKSECCQRIVHGGSGKRKGIDADANQIRLHSRCKMADIITAEHVGTPSGRDPKGFPSGHRWVAISGDALEQQCLPGLRQHVRAVVGRGSIHTEAHPESGAHPIHYARHTRSEPHVG